MNRAYRIAIRTAAALSLMAGTPRAAHASPMRVWPHGNTAYLSAFSFPFAVVDDGDDDKEEREQELYEEGTDAIDESHWQQAVDKFDQVIQMHGKRADAALYWKAWAQNKLGRRPDALATLADLKRTAPQSRWTNDAKALEIEIRQQSSQPVPPDGESNCELKLLAINGLQQMDPERAVPMLEKMLHGGDCPKLRSQALFVLAQSNSPQARQVIARAARNDADPELQRKAVQSLGTFSGEWGRQQLAEVYASTSSVELKKRILNALMISGDRARILAAAKGEKDPALRAEAIQQLGVMGATGDIWELYTTETSTDVKKRILQAMFIAGDRDHMVQLAKAEKDPQLRIAAIRNLGMMGDKTGDALQSLYAENNRDVKKAVIQALFISNNAHSLVELARKETDPEMKKDIVRQLSLMQSKEATDYMLEILNK